MTTGPGLLARVGQLYPSGGICDHEIQLMAPPGVRFHTTRLPFRHTGLTNDLALADELERHARLLADAQVDMIAFNCTAASMLIGPKQIRQRVQQATDIRCVTTIDAVRAALRFFGVRRIGLLTPYPAEVEEREVAYLAEHGIEVIDQGGPVCESPIEQGSIAPTEWARQAQRLEVTAADAILLSCAGSHFAPAIEPIEQLTGLPVITSNQALLWHVLQFLQIPARVTGYGTLLEPSASAKPDRLNPTAQGKSTHQASGIDECDAVNAGEPPVRRHAAPRH